MSETIKFHYDSSNDKYDINSNLKICLKFKLKIVLSQYVIQSVLGQAVA